MIARLFAIALTLTLTPALAAQNQFGVQPLALGDQAPDFGSDKVDWLKGEPITEFEEGHIYVLDFWATWCTPCIQVMPALTEIQEKYEKDNVHVVALAIWPAPGMVPTRKFVSENGEIMAYTVGEARGEWVANNFMLATGNTGIPTSMIIGRDGALLHIGHPMSPTFHQVLDGVVSGEIDSTIAKEMAAKQEQAQRLYQEANAFAIQGNWDAALTVIDEIVALDPNAFADLAVAKFQRLLITLERYDEAYAYGDNLIDTLLNDKPYLLELVARTITDAPGLARRELPLARKAIDRCIKLIGTSDEAAMATYATVLLKQGETEKAIEAINSALKIATAKDSQWLAEITDRRDEILAEAGASNEESSD